MGVTKHEFWRGGKNNGHYWNLTIYVPQGDTSRIVGASLPTTDPGEYAVDNANFRLRCGQKAPDLGHQYEQRGLAQIGGFSGHVWPGNNQQARRLGVEQHVVRHEFPALERLFQNRMTTISNFDAPRFAELRAGVLVQPRHLG